MVNIKICDITLRDGEQAAGVNFFPEDKLRIAEKLALMNVPIIEAGFAIASPSDFKGIELISRKIGVSNGPVSCSMARAIRNDIRCAVEALKYAAKPRIQIVFSTSDIHLKHKLNMDRSQAKDIVHEMVSYAKSLIDDVGFIAEDATRTDINFLVEIFNIAVNAGANIVGIPDTVGYSTPDEYGSIVKAVSVSLPDNITISTHCHNDLGLAVANTLSGISAGATQAEVTVNGLGERAGNASLEEVVMALATRKDIYNVDTNIDTRHILNISKLVCELSGINVQKNKAIVGANAFLHESGIHQDGMLKNTQTYQIINPEQVGWHGNQIVIGKHSGKKVLMSGLKKIGIHLADKELEEFFVKFKKVSSKKKSITISDLKDIANNH